MRAYMLSKVAAELRGRIAVTGEAWLPLSISATYVTSDFDTAVVRYLNEFESIGSDLVIAVNYLLPFRQGAFDELIAHAAFNDVRYISREVSEALNAARELIIIGIQSDRGWVSTPLFNSSLVVIKNKIMAIADEFGAKVTNSDEYFIVRITSPIYRNG